MQLNFNKEIAGRSVSLKLGFVIDPLDSRRAYNDPAVALMRAAHSHGHEVYAIQAPTLGWHQPESGQPGGVFGEVLQLHLRPDDHDWYREISRTWRPLHFLDALMVSLDPPADAEFFAATWLLERAEADGLRVFNRPRALREHSEKIATAEFPQFTPTTLITRHLGKLREFIDSERDVILKPIDGGAKVRVFRVHRNDRNRNAIAESLTDDGRRTIIAQRYLPEIDQGDKRILLIAGKVVPWCLARIPRAGETRGSLAAGGTGVAQELSARDREIAETLAPILLKRGLLIVGLDVIGDFLTGINVSHPCGMTELRQQCGFDAAGATISAIERACGLT
ncbi:MAG: glutathione synthase [Azonexus sp.]